MKKINEALLNDISSQARLSSRQRKNYNLHADFADPLQRLLNAMEPFSYIQPHKHENPDKREIFFSLRGRIAVVEFDESGTVTDHIVLNPQKGIYGCEISSRTFHTIVSLDQGTVAFEVKDGPYNVSDDKCFAKWAPKEGEEGTKEYIVSLLNRIGIPYN